MTQADSATTALRRSLDSDAECARPGQATTRKKKRRRATCTDDLPAGWTAFFSKADPAVEGYWYAVAPYLAANLPPYKPGTDEQQTLSQTVVAYTWADLHEKVAAEVELYRKITDD
ncbi:hypothetical protein [Allostreptomyces psammosilenae]|uniref:Uncharacterized protein n=1 Tax=Allostreptomyces psammosilenae TaxID=1892865 RepID=A0A852ZUN5_9ACTN|nr:hypothetical protein [Allostreptomyces psammosilenae]NYI06096.1 hypothetical protein [Allostreptomyces psammosilenae]